MLRIERLSTRAFSDLSFHAAEGCCTAIVGRSGSGKTTLLNAIAGTIPCQGHIAIDGRRVDNMPAWRRPSMAICP